MKKIKNNLKLLAILLMVIPLLQVRADDVDDTYEGFQTNFGDSVVSKNTVNGSALEAGNTVDSKNEINGIALLLGNKIDFNGSADYSLFAGNILNLSGTVNNDSLIMGNDITLNEDFTVNRDSFIFGNQVKLDGSYNRNVTIYANKVIIEGAINGIVTVNAATIDVKEGTVINGLLKYNSDAEYSEEGNTAIAQKQKTAEINVKTGYMEQFMYTIRNMSFMLVIFLVLALLVPQLFKKIDEQNKDITVFKGLSLIGFGALTLICLPIIAVLFMSLYFGYPLAFILLIVSGILVYMHNVFTGYLLGSIIWNKFIKKEPNMFITGMIGLIIIYILYLIPVLNTLIMVISLLMSVGIIINLFKRQS